MRSGLDRGSEDATPQKENLKRLKEDLQKFSTSPRNKTKRDQAKKIEE
jgi:hypothetical protein